MSKKGESHLSHARTYLLCLLSVAATANVQSDSNAAAADNNISGGGSIPSTGGIVGLAVAGVTTLICFIEFFVWSSTLTTANAHSGARNDHALPVTQSEALSTGTTPASRRPPMLPAPPTSNTQDDPWSILRSLPRARAADVQRGRARRAAGGLRCGWGVDCDDANGAHEPGTGMIRADGEPGVVGGVWWDVGCSLPAQTDRDNDKLAARRAGSRGRKRCRASLPPSASHVRIHALMTPYPPSFAPISTRAGGLRPRQAAVKR
ncbi:hypothetical protein B0H14DRAFT_3143379 [Mycena olivaceomarginata]|nr:hypothetical protein B0H14DRAFT_3143379 [Mycena olivaceomarginata]